MKKLYEKPELVIHGDVEEITQNQNQTNSDGQGNDTALPNPT